MVVHPPNILRRRAARPSHKEVRQPEREAMAGETPESHHESGAGVFSWRGHRFADGCQGQEQRGGDADGESEFGFRVAVCEGWDGYLESGAGEGAG